MRYVTRMAEMAGFAMALVCLASAPARAETQDLDSPKADPAHHKVEIENDRVRVVRYVIPSHDKTALHNHPSLVNVLLTDSSLKVTTPDGKTSEIHGKAGTAAWRGPTVHVVENVGDKPVEGILVEPKGPGNPAWTPPARDSVKTDPSRHKVEFENDQVRIERFWYERGEKAPMHDHPANVLIFLTDAHSRATTPDGKVSESHPKAGEARFREPLTHAVENLGDRFEGFVIALKGASARPGGK